MQISMYQASAPRFINSLRNLSAILDRAKAHVETKKIEPTALIAARLYPDMYAFARQVQIACDNAKGAVARLAGVEPPIRGWWQAVRFLDPCSRMRLPRCDSGPSSRS